MSYPDSYNGLAPKTHNRITIISLLCMLALVIACVIRLFIGVEQSADTIRVLKNMGFTDITTDGMAPGYCGVTDVYKTKFYATAVNGEDVRGAVCGNIFKSYTIHLR